MGRMCVNKICVNIHIYPPVRIIFGFFGCSNIRLLTRHRKQARARGKFSPRPRAGSPGVGVVFPPGGGSGMTGGGTMEGGGTVIVIVVVMVVQAWNERGT